MLGSRPGLMKHIDVIGYLMTKYTGKEMRDEQPNAKRQDGPVSSRPNLCQDPDITVLLCVKIAVVGRGPIRTATQWCTDPRVHSHLRPIFVLLMRAGIKGTYARHTIRFSLQNIAE